MSHRCKSAQKFPRAPENKVCVWHFGPDILGLVVKEQQNMPRLILGGFMIWQHGTIIILCACSFNDKQSFSFSQVKIDRMTY